MRKIVIIALLSSFGVNAFALTQNRRIELLEMAVVKLIKENKNLKNEIYNLQTENRINTQMIFKLNNTINAIKDKSIYAKVLSLGLNVRENPSIKSKIIGRLKKGDLVKIKGAILNKNTIWYKIDNGYISSAFTALIYGGKIKKEKIPALRFMLPNIVKTKNTKKTLKPKQKDFNKTKVTIINIPPKPKEIPSKVKNGAN